MTIHFEWKVLFCTTEAQLVHNLGALWSAEMLQEVTLRRAHPLFGTRPCAAPCLQHCCVTHKPGRNVPCGIEGERSYFICLPLCMTSKSILHSIPCMQLVVKSMQVQACFPGFYWVAETVCTSLAVGDIETVSWEADVQIQQISIKPSGYYSCCNYK